MANIKIIKGEFEKELALPMAPDIFANAIKHEHRSKNPTTRWLLTSLPMPSSMNTEVRIPPHDGQILLS